MPAKIVTLENDEGEEFEAELPTKWEICGDCRGEGKTYLGWRAKDQPAFTAEDFDREGPDFREDYFSGRYDKDCPACSGTGKVLEVDEAACKASGKYSEFVLYEQIQQSDREYERDCELERCYGA